MPQAERTQTLRVPSATVKCCSSVWGTARLGVNMRAGKIQTSWTVMWESVCKTDAAREENAGQAGGTVHKRKGKQLMTPAAMDGAGSSTVEARRAKSGFDTSSCSCWPPETQVGSEPVGPDQKN